MANFNRVILMGNLTRDPEVRYTPQGTPVATFGFAVNRRYRQGDEQREETCFVDIVAFGRQAELVGQYLSKGRGALVEGRLQHRTWEGEDGVKRSKHEVVAQSVTFLPQGGGGGGGRRPQAEEPDFGETPPSGETPLSGETPPSGEPPSSTDDDIPF